MLLLYLLGDQDVNNMRGDEKLPIRIAMTPSKKRQKSLSYFSERNDLIVLGIMLGIENRPKKKGAEIPF